jgi:hypothetical protein
MSAKAGKAHGRVGTAGTRRKVKGRGARGVRKGDSGGDGSGRRKEERKRGGKSDGDAVVETLVLVAGSGQACGRERSGSAPPLPVPIATFNV